MNIKVIVAAHKPYRMPEDPMYLPLQVGAVGKPSLGWKRDDEGENISAKNPYYCELTAIYWAWKNLNADAIGLAHYRRHFALRRSKDPFACVLSHNEAEAILKKTPLIFPKKRNYYIETLRSHYLHSHRPEGLTALCAVIKEFFPAYAAACEDVLNRRSGHMFNMYIMRKDLFDDYCSWMFSVLLKVESCVDLTGFSRNEARIFGYISEFMADIYFTVHPVPYTEVPVIFMEKQSWLKKGSTFLRRKFFPEKFD